MAEATCRQIYDHYCNRIFYEKLNTNIIPNLQQEGSEFHMSDGGTLVYSGIMFGDTAEGKQRMSSKICQTGRPVRGFGRITYKQRLYVGWLTGFNFDGLGFLYRNNQVVYFGDFAEGYKHGYGAEINGAEIFLGDFVKGKKQGEGSLIVFKEENKYVEIEGVWNDDKLIEKLSQQVKTISRQTYRVFAGRHLDIPTYWTDEPRRSPDIICIRIKN